MKPLPVIQDPGAAAPAETSSSAGGPAPLETSGIVHDPDRAAALEPSVIQALSKVFDPEIPVNIYELGLIYGILVDRDGVVGIRMTLTAPACPAAQFLPVEVKKRVGEVPGVSDVKVDVVWDPPWDRDRMSAAAKLQLGIF